MPLQRAAVDEVGEGELRQGGRAEVGSPALADQVVVQVGGRDHPPDPQRRGEHFGQARDRARRARGLRRAGRRAPGAVVAVLGVVVVLDHQPAACLGPGEEFSASVRSEHDAGRELMRRGHQHRTGVGTCERRDIEPRTVNGDRVEGVEPVVEDAAVAVGAGIFDGAVGDALVAQHLGEEAERSGDVRR